MAPKTKKDIMKKKTKVKKAKMKKDPTISFAFEDTFLIAQNPFDDYLTNGTISIAI